MSLETALPIMPPGSIILEVNWNGEILNSWHSNLFTLRTFSEAQIIVSLFILKFNFDIIIYFSFSRMATCTLVHLTTIFWPD